VHADMRRNDTAATPVHAEAASAVRNYALQPHPCDDVSGYWTAEVRLITQQDEHGTSGYTLLTYTEPHDPANGSSDLTEQVPERATGQFANRLAELLAGPYKRSRPDE